MKYINEVNAFYNWQTTNQLSAAAINLWHALMHVANRAGWPKEFTVALARLQLLTGCSKSSVCRARLELKEHGRIDYTSRAGQQAAVYTILPFPSLYASDGGVDVAVPRVVDSPERTLDPADTQSGTQLESQLEPQADTIIRQEQTKPDKDLFDDADAASAEASVTPKALFVHHFSRAPTPAEREACVQLLRLHNPELVEYAFYRACATGNHHLAYVTGVLSTLRQRAIKDLDDVAQDNLNREKKRRR